MATLVALWGCMAMLRRWLLAYTMFTTVTTRSEQLPILVLDICVRNQLGQAICIAVCTHQYTIQIGCYTHVNHDSSLCWRAKILLTIPIHKEHPRRMWMPFFLQVFGYKLKYTDKFKFLSEMLAVTKDFRVHPEWDWMCEQNLEKLTLTLTLTNCQYLRARESFWSELPNLTWQYLMHPYKRMWTAYYSKVLYYTWEYLFSAFQM